MRVVIVGFQTFNVDGTYVGGTEKVTDSIIRYFVGKGDSVLYVCTWPIGRKKQALYKKAYGVRVKSFEDALAENSIEAFFPDLIFMTTIYRQFMLPIFEEVGRMAQRVPTIVYGHGTNVCNPKKLPDSLTRGKLVTFAALSRNVRARQEACGTGPTRIVDVVNMADVPELGEVSEDFEFDVVSIARAVPQKGIDNVARLCAAMGYEVAFIGAGANENRKLYAEIVDMLGDKAHLLGTLQRDDMFKVMAKSRFIGFMPNSEEGMPLSVIEAMAMGVPAITWDKVTSTDCVDRSMNVVLRADGGYIEQYKREYAPRIHELLSKESRMALARRTRGRFGMEAYKRQLDNLICKAMEVR